MRIYHNSQFTSELRGFVFKNQGDLLNLLIGINLQEDEQGNIHVYPVYRGIRFVRFPDCHLIEIPLFQKSLIIVFEKWRIRMMLLKASNLVDSDVGNHEK